MPYIANKPGLVFRGIAFKETFTGDGSTTVFDCTNPFNAGGQNDLRVYVADVIQEPGTDYTAGPDGNGDYKRITFTSAPANSAAIFIMNPGVTNSILTPTDNSVTSAKLNADAITGQTDLTTGLQGADELLIYDNSAGANKKVNLDNLITGQTELSSQAADDDVLLVYDTSATEIKKIQKSNIATTLSYSVNSNLTGDGSTTAFTIGTSGRTANDILVSVDGILFHPSDDYTLSGTTLTFSTPPVASAEIRVRYLPA